MMFALYAVGIGGSDALLCHHCSGLDEQCEPGVSAWDQELDAHGPRADDLIGTEPNFPGFWVWMGRRVAFRDYEGGVDDVELQGSWSKATNSEVARFVHGASPSVVFADRIER